ncbi:MAG: serine hydrolase [Pseudomonadota bacterium]
MERSGPRTEAGQVTLSNALEPPHNRWAFRNMGVLPSVMTPRGDATTPLHSPITAPADAGAEAAFDASPLDPVDGEGTLLDALLADSADGIIVVKIDRAGGAPTPHIVYQRYFSGFSPRDHHLLASITKSVLSLAAGQMISEGLLDPARPVAAYLPELASSGGFGEVALAEAMNMSTALDFSEDYANLAPGSVHLEYFRRIGLTPSYDLMQLDPATDPTPRGVRRFLPRFGRQAAVGPGEVFEYQSPNADVVGWIIERVSGRALQEVVSERIWAPLGAAHDAFMVTDLDFDPIATGGLNATLPDLARLGACLLQDGMVDGRQVVPAAWVRDIPSLTDADRARVTRSQYKEPGGELYDGALEGYRNFWWIHDAARGIYTARGVFGQMLYIHRAADVAIATVSSAPIASNAGRPSFHVKLRALERLAEGLA